MISYPPFPAYNGNLEQTLIQLLLWLPETILAAIGNFFEYITGATETSAGNTISQIIAFPGTVFQQSVHAFSGYGIFAPLIASVIWGLTIAVLIYFAFFAVKIATHETEEDF